MPVQYQKPDDNVLIAQAVEVWGEGPEISPYPDNIPVSYDIPGVGATPPWPLVGVPPGGAPGQVLTKQSGSDYDTAWESGPKPVVIQPDEPTAADYGEATIPLNAVWIDTE